MLRRESCKHLAPPRNTKNREHQLSTQTTANRHNSQAKHLVSSKGQPKSRITPIQHSSHARPITATSCHNYAHPAGSSPDPLSQRNPVRGTCGLSHITTQTPPAPARTCSAPRLGGLLPEEVVDSQERTASRWGLGGEGGNEGRGG